MSVEGWDTEGSLPPATITAVQGAANYAPPPPLTRGNEPGEVVILVEIDTFSG